MTPAVPFGHRSVATIPSSPSCPVMALFNSMAKTESGSPDQEPHEVKLVNASIDNNPATVEALLASPSSGAERIFFLEVNQPQVAYCAFRHQPLALADLREIADIFSATMRVMPDDSASLMMAAPSSRV